MCVCVFFFRLPSVTKFLFLIITTEAALGNNRPLLDEAQGS